MTHHRRRPPIRLRRQWEREAAEWWREHDSPIRAASDLIYRIDHYEVGPVTPNGRYCEVRVVGQDFNGRWVETKAMVDDSLVCPVPTFPRR